MKKPETDTTSKTVEIKYTKKDIEDLREQGVPKDELPKIGKHKFRRSRFITAESEQKIKITMYLDADILSFFKKRAEDSHAAPYQTQINAELRKIMENVKSDETNKIAQTIADDETINRLADILADKLRDKIAA